MTVVPQFGFTGQRMAAQSGTTGIYDYGARFYDPALGRFLQPDSIVPNATHPQSLNPYSYVENNPLNRVDPSGNLPVGPGFGGTSGSNINILAATNEHFGDPFLFPLPSLLDSPLSGGGIGAGSLLSGPGFTVGDTGPRLPFSQDFLRLAGGYQLPRGFQLPTRPARPDFSTGKDFSTGFAGPILLLNPITGRLNKRALAAVSLPLLGSEEIGGAVLGKSIEFARPAVSAAVDFARIQGLFTMGATASVLSTTTTRFITRSLAELDEFGPPAVNFGSDFLQGLVVQGPPGPRAGNEAGVLVGRGASAIKDPHPLRRFLFGQFDK